MKRFGILALVAMMSLFTLVVTSCSKPSTPAPAEKVVNLSDLPPLYKSGQVLEFPSYDSTTYRWMDCKDSSMHFGTKLIPGMPKIVITQGEHVALEKILGVSEGEELILREKDETSPTSVTKPNPEPMVKKPSVSADEETPASLAGNIPWHWLGYILIGVLSFMMVDILRVLFRRLARWISAPLSRHSVQTHTSVTENVTEHRHHESNDNTRGAVVIHRAGDMVERTTTVIERFVIRGNHPNDRSNNGGRRYRDVQ